jgi:predicted transcriptional regulator
MADNGDTKDLLALTAEIVSAHISNNKVATADLPDLLARVHQSLSSVGTGAVAGKRPEPAVSIKQSIRPDYIVCLEDGKKLKMLKRHLMTSYKLTPDAYRERWGLSPDYPMVAPNYAKQRSRLAKEIGLGTRGRKKRRLLFTN